MVFALQQGALSGLIDQARRGLRYGEDIFCSVYTYSHSGDIRSLINAFLEHILANKQYKSFLEKTNVHEIVLSTMTMPGFFDKLKEMSKNELYRKLVFHLPASDLFDQAEITQESRILLHEFQETRLTNTIHIIVNTETIVIIHTILQILQ